ncbi:hypothetical protein [Bosea minatitlanensis]|uniref:Uncharacterized protein n=1 Tax=Bosea minatitlanensis TaxID=128782 RepID=A0ABW0EZJ4_9HYPH|nr:hypothetical protein [Bosea minatitlanensis]MCT4492638.1 hypothetical protein [Bosea minatitlanensis]
MTIHSARWWVAWNPNATTPSANGVRLVTADSGPTNIVAFIGATLTRASTTSPVVDAVDITSAMQDLLDARVRKTIGHQIVGNGTSGPKI